jgi:aspartate/methionine/tyrosine aminotransferase
MIDDALAAIAMKNLDRIYERNRKLLKTNLEILTNWVENEPLVDWIPPKAASVVYLKQHTKISSEKLCVKLINEKNTFLVPGECFEMEGFIRMGFGNKTEILQEGLKRFKEFLDQFR